MCIAKRRQRQNPPLRPEGTAILALVLLALVACDEFEFPRDPNDTLTRVMGSDRLRVASINNEPWVAVQPDGPPKGAEVELVEAFARDLGVAIEWRVAPAFKAFDALKSAEIDLAVGGFTTTEVNAHPEAAQTFAYYTEVLLVAAEPGAPLPDRLDGEQVYTPPGLLANGIVEKAGGVPVAEDGAEIRLAALPHWLLPSRGMVPTDIVLRREEHVWAVPQGENAWLMRVEQFLRSEGGSISAKLRKHAP